MAAGRRSPTRRRTHHPRKTRPMVQEHRGAGSPLRRWTSEREEQYRHPTHLHVSFFPPPYSLLCAHVHRPPRRPVQWSPWYFTATALRIVGACTTRLACAYAAFVMRARAGRTAKAASSVWQLDGQDSGHHAGTTSSECELTWTAHAPPHAHTTLGGCNPWGVPLQNEWCQKNKWARPNFSPVKSCPEGFRWRVVLINLTNKKTEEKYTHYTRDPLPVSDMARCVPSTRCRGRVSDAACPRNNGQACGSGGGSTRAVLSTAATPSLAA
jgi:hypothetical protein